MKIDRPIFIVGSGRSGTEILNDLISLHPELCWISNVSERLPYLPFSPALHRILDCGEFGKGLKRQIVNQQKGWLHVSPIEPDSAYKAVGFHSENRFTEDDYSIELDTRFRKLIAQHLFWAKKSRFVSKQTANTQRYRLLNKIFPDALFVHLIRDGRAVANSMLQSNWIDSLSLWWTGDKAKRHLPEYSDVIQLYGMHWLNNVNELQGSRELLGDRYFELRYEDFIQDVRGSIGQIESFSGLKSSVDYEALLPATLPNMNYKWTSELSDLQQSLLEQTIGEKLRELGYITS